MELRAELAPDRSGSYLIYQYADGHAEDGTWSLDFERLCREFQRSMRQPDGKLWKVVLMTIEVPGGHVRTEFEWDDPSRWDLDMKYRQPGLDW